MVLLYIQHLHFSSWHLRGTDFLHPLSFSGCYSILLRYMSMESNKWYFFTYNNIVTQSNHPKQRKKNLNTEKCEFCLKFFGLYRWREAHWASSIFSTNVTVLLTSELTPFSGYTFLTITKQCLLTLELHAILSTALGIRQILFSYSSKKIFLYDCLLTTSFFTELEQRILKFAWKHKWLQIAKVILRKEN